MCVCARGGGPGLGGDRDANGQFSRDEPSKHTGDPREETKKTRNREERKQRNRKIERETDREKKNSGRR